MSIEAIRCPGCHNLVNVANLDQHYRSAHKEGITQGASIITSANPPPEIPEWARTLVAQAKIDNKKPHPFDSPLWGPLLRRFFPHIVFGALALGIIIGILTW